MDTSFSIQVLQTKEKLIQLINESNLPIVVVDLIILELQNVIRMQMAAQIEKEKSKVESEEG